MSPRLKTVRRCVQAGVLLGYPVLAWLNSQGWERLSGNFLSFSVLGFPLADPLAAVQVCLGSLALPWKIALGGGVALGLALALGPVFCSWACPFGTLSDLAWSLRGIPSSPRKQGWRPKAVLAALACLALALSGLPPMLNQFSLPGWYSRIFQAWFNQQELALPGLLLLAGALGAEALAGRRLWGRYVCPQSVLLQVMHRFSPIGLRVRFDAKRCTCSRGDEQCGRACPLDLNPRMAGKGLEWECTVCGDCTQACAVRGKALTLGFGPGKH